MRALTHGFACLSFLAALMLVVTGCSPTKTEPAKDHKKREKEGHSTEGPHGGTLVEWGEEEYHAEFTVNREKKEITVYILDKTAQKVTPIEAETVTVTLTNVTPSVQVVLKASPDGDEGKGKSSRFVGDETVGEKGAYKGQIEGKVAGVTYTGPFETNSEGKAIKKK